MERNEPGERESTKDREVEHFDDYEEFHQRILEELAEGTDQTPEEIQETVESYPMPDPDELETVPAEEFYDDI
jgi:hypothetical protein